jgi:hypothetical protein
MSSNGKRARRKAEGEGMNEATITLIWVCGAFAVTAIILLGAYYIGK